MSILDLLPGYFSLLPSADQLGVHDEVVVEVLVGRGVEWPAAGEHLEPQARIRRVGNDSPPAGNVALAICCTPSTEKVAVRPSERTTSTSLDRALRSLML